MRKAIGVLAVLAIVLALAATSAPAHWGGPPSWGRAQSAHKSDKAKCPQGTRNKDYCEQR